MAPLPNLPATNLTDAFNACEPAAPLDAGDPRYVDLTPGRGEQGSAVAECRKRILRSSSPLVQLFAGHRGCGKSTELRRLQHDLEEDGYFVAFFKAEQSLDLEDTESPDVLMTFVRGLEEVLRDAGHPFQANLLDDFLLWFGEVVWEETEHKQIEARVHSQVGLGVDVPLFAKLLAQLTGQLKTGTDSRKKLRQQLDPQVSQLVLRGGLLVQAARTAVRAAGYTDLVAIVDDLDRIALKDRGDGRTSHEVLFIERGNLLKGFGCHSVVTVPISLLFSPKLANLNAIFPDRHVLPMVKLTVPETGDPWKRGRVLFGDLLWQRLDLKELFEDGAPEYLIEKSGGHPRILMTLVRFALDFVDDPPVTKEVVGKAFRRLVNDYGRSIPEKHWPLLARVHRHRAVKNDDDHQLMLFNLSVLEYQNRDRWCDVQPAILELPPFQEALDKLDEGAEGD